MKFYRLSGAAFYDCINTIYQFIKNFLVIKTSIFRNIEPLRGIDTFSRETSLSKRIYSFLNRGLLRMLFIFERPLFRSIFVRRKINR